MASLLLSRRDLDFLLYEWLDVELLTKRERYAEHSRETFDAVLDLSEQVATRHFAPHNKKNDAQEPTFDGQRVQLIPEVQAGARRVRRDRPDRQQHGRVVGGCSCRASVAGACFAWFQARTSARRRTRSSPSATPTCCWRTGTPEQVETYVRRWSRGRFFGTMCLSEPQAGSSLSDVTTRAEPQDDGSYRLFGNKMWISAGEHELSENIVHLVLAKIPGGPAGVKGISLFVVPKVLVQDDGALGERNDVVLAGLNHKMGYRGTTNTMLNFGEGVHTPGGRPGAVGYLVASRTRACRTCST
jgi:butyryl-CoA dehydrogenase